MQEYNKHVVILFDRRKNKPIYDNTSTNRHRIHLVEILQTPSIFHENCFNIYTNSL